ncbi:MAG: hypothetical protein ACKOJH_11065 [Actinomycetota bacterium]
MNVKRVFRVTVLITHLALVTLGTAVILNGVIADRSGLGEDWSVLVGFVVILAAVVSAIVLLPLSFVVRRSSGDSSAYVSSRRLLWGFLASYLLLPLTGLWWLGFAYVFAVPALVAFVLVVSLLLNTSTSERKSQ